MIQIAGTKFKVEKSAFGTKLKYWYKINFKNKK